LKAGESIALVSDAGTPLISDPGQTLVATARAEGIRVESIPGPSAVMAAIASCGFPTHEFVFLGFPPNRSKDRKTWLTAVGQDPRLAVFFEAPHRVRQTLAEMRELWGPARQIAVARELTKVHEELVIRPIDEILVHFSDPRGEFTIVVPPADDEKPSSVVPDLAQLRVELSHLTNNNATKRRQALKVLADRHGMTVNDLYRQLGTTEDPGE
jgi:16S rRNA (cytidine1402-2'-O)-methyltransferase